MSQPLVSVAVLSYNQRDFLRECLDSVLAQEYPSLEVVVADDASTDGSRELLEQYAERHPGIVKALLQPSNVGITANSNALIEACSGEYVAWIGGDDVMLPGKIATQVAYMEANAGVALSFHDLEVFDSATNQVMWHFNSGPGSHAPREGGADLFVEFGTFAGACSIMTRRAATPAAGFDPRVKIASDWLYWIETCVNGTVGYIDAVLARYRRHERNVTDAERGSEDLFITLAIVEERYPGLLRAVRRGRARIYYIEAARAMRSGRRSVAAQYAAAGLRQALPSPAHAGVWRRMLEQRRLRTAHREAGPR